MEKRKSNLWIDVRSPVEYQKGHIPGAVNIPIFSDEERVLIGTIYKQKSSWEAIQKGFEIAIPKSESIVDTIRATCQNSICTLYCWRGGMRSQAVAELLRDEGMDYDLLEGGYKAYRRQNEVLFSRPMNIHLLGGLTGSGKTEKLKELKESGEQVLDLENLANHKGGCFGHIGQSEQPSTEHFHNLIAQELSQVDPRQTLWIEDEGRVLGSCHLPEALYKQMRNSPIDLLSCSLEERLQRLNRTYGKADPLEWISCIQNLQKKLGPEKTKLATQYIHSGRLRDAALIVLSYYDKCYQSSFKKRSY